MSHAAEQNAQAEQARAWQELEVWHAGNVIREAFKRGDAEVVTLIQELKEKTNEAD